MGEPPRQSSVLARYLAAVLFMLTGGMVLWFNATHGARVIVLPLLTTIAPSLRGRPEALGGATAALFVVAGVVLGLGRLAIDLWRRWHARAASRQQSRHCSR